ncbi:uncharacterized protein LOC135436242 [Drosophila montana]|uniref:uncharacterized protein LOC135436242 n=1 Tax=Drosophila montana TaxID=40370 RepID=UPI00313EE668
MEFLHKKYLEATATSNSLKLARLEANLVPFKSKRTPMLAQKSTEINDSGKHNGLDREVDSTKTIIAKTKNNDEKLLTIIKNNKTRLRKLYKELELNTSDEPSGKRENCVLHVNYKEQEAALVCQVSTANLVALKQRLSKVLLKYKSRFRPVHSEPGLFKQMGLIHVLMPCKTAIDFASLEEQLHRDALSCQAEGCKIVSIEMGALCFRCQPEGIPEVSAKLRLCGYKPLLTEIGYYFTEPLEKLTAAQMRRYSQFLKALQADADIVKIYDNVQNSVVHSMYTG